MFLRVGLGVIEYLITAGPPVTFAHILGSICMNNALLASCRHANRGSCYDEAANPGPDCWTFPMGRIVDGHQGAASYPSKRQFLDQADARTAVGVGDRASCHIAIDECGAVTRFCSDAIYCAGLCASHISSGPASFGKGISPAVTVAAVTAILTLTPEIAEGPVALTVQSVATAVTPPVFTTDLTCVSFGGATIVSRIDRFIVSRSRID